MTTSCQTIPDRSTAQVAAAIATETAASLRCPRSAVELTLLTGARLAFDLATLNAISIETRMFIDNLRARTNEICDIEETP